MKRTITAFLITSILFVGGGFSCSHDSPEPVPVSPPGSTPEFLPKDFYAMTRVDFEVALSGGSKAMGDDTKAAVNCREAETEEECNDLGKCVWDIRWNKCADKQTDIVIEVLGPNPGELVISIDSPQVNNYEDVCTCAELTATWTFDEPATSQQTVRLLGRFAGGGVFWGVVDPLFFVDLYYLHDDRPDPCTQGTSPGDGRDYELLTWANINVADTEIVFSPVFFCGNFYNKPPQAYEETLYLAVSGLAPRVVFVTSETYNGNLGGRFGGDQRCQALADEAGLPGEYRAWISDRFISPHTLFTKTGGPFQLVNGSQVALDWADLTDGTLESPINVDEMGNTISDGFVWTNTWAGGTVTYTGYEETCESWGIDFPNMTGSGGNLAEMGVTWTALTVSSCDAFLHLYCFQQ